LHVPAEAANWQDSRLDYAFHALLSRLADAFLEPHSASPRYISVLFETLFTLIAGLGLVLLALISLGWYRPHDVLNRRLIPLDWQCKRCQFGAVADSDDSN